MSTDTILQDAKNYSKSSSEDVFVAEAGVTYNPPPEALRDWIHLANLPISSKAINALLAAFLFDPTAIFEASDNELDNVVGVQSKQLVRIRQSAYDTQERQISWFYRHAVQLVTINDPRYPEALKQIPDPPAFLFVRGALPQNTMNSIGIVGSRRSTPYGIAAATKLAKELVENDVIVVSGGADGIDSAAHWGAVRAGGCTIAVLGCGLDVDYPRNNRTLFEEIIKNGALITEYPPGAQPDSWRFPLRNRIISGITLGTVVIEAPIKSGALITADRAVEQGKVLMATPGNIDRPSSVGSNDLLRAGATPILETQDILYAVGLISVPASPNHQGVMEMVDEAENSHISERSATSTKKANSPAVVTSPTQRAAPKDLPADQMKLVNVLTKTPQHVDSLAKTAEMTASQTSIALLSLEMGGWAKRLPGNLYIRTL